MLSALGSNGSAQLGVGHSCDLTAPASITLQDPIRISQIASGGNHTLFLLANGTVLGCGNEQALPVTLTINTEEVQPTHSVMVPTALQISPGVELTGVAHITATWAASIFVTNEGAVLVSGRGSHGELGLGSNMDHSQFPRAIPDFPPAETRIHFIQSGMAHTIVILDNGEVWGWGRGRQGQLGDPCVEVWHPRRVYKSTIFKPVRAACGKDFTCLVDHEESGILLLLGLNKRDRFHVRSGAPLAVPSWKSLVASWGGIYILDKSGYLTAWGRDDHGQMPAKNLPRLVAISAGSEHCLALTERNEVLAWGWGEHGNCGLPIDATGDVKSSWNVLVRTSKPVAMHAGCATSFMFDIGE